MTKPLKRDKHLAWFSRDHHDGLLIVWKIRQGLHKRVPATTLADFVVHEFDTYLSPHFAEEEAFLFNELPPTNVLRMEAEADHAVMRELVIALEAATSSYLIEEFAEKLEQHIRFEERHLFPLLQAILSAAELEAIGNELEKSHKIKIIDSWTNEFWKTPVATSNEN